MTQIQILINIQFNNDVIFKYLWIYIKQFTSYANLQLKFDLLYLPHALSDNPKAYRRASDLR